MNSSRDTEPDIDQPATIAIDQPRTRRQLLTTGGVAALAGMLGAIGISSSVEAKNGDAVRAGKKTVATTSTLLQSRKGTGFFARVTGGGNVTGLRGQVGSNKGKGVIGVATAKKGATVGVEGVTHSPAGTAGQFVANKGGTAITAKSADRKGTALRTDGKLDFGGRSGSAQTSGGSELVLEVKGGLSNKSLVLATLQDHVPGVHVESAAVLDASGNLIVIRLNQAVAEPTRVAWFILD